MSLLREDKGVCEVCGQELCKCERVLASIRKSSPDSKTEHRKVEKFREQVRSLARRNKYNR